MPKQSFDFSEEAKEFQGLNRRRRPMLFGVSIALALLAILAVGVFVGGATSGGRTLLWTSGSISLVIVCVVFSVVVGIAAFRSRVDVVRIEIVDDGVELFGSRDAGSKIRWTDSDARFTIRDIRGWAAEWSKGTPRRVDFILSARGTPPFPVTLAATVALIHGAKTHGLRVSGWSEEPPAPMSTRVIRIRHS